MSCRSNDNMHLRQTVTSAALRTYVPWTYVPSTQPECLSVRGHQSGPPDGTNQPSFYRQTTSTHRQMLSLDAGDFPNSKRRANFTCGQVAA
jgi:hypothetical protein